MAELNPVETMARRRFRTMKRDSIRFDKFPPLYGDVEALLYKAIADGGICYYCGKKLQLKDDPPYKAVYSIDHKLPLSLGGDNLKSNLVVCCHECNIIKSTMKAETFQRFLNVIKEHDPELLSIIFDEMWRGRLANKLERLGSDEG